MTAYNTTSLSYSFLHHVPPTQNEKSPSEDSVIDDDVQSQLVSLCTKDGTAEQARNAVFTLASLLENDPDKKIDVFKPLLETLTSSTRLTLNGAANKKVVSVLATLTALVENAPAIFSSAGGKKDRGVKAIRFAFETILLGRGDGNPTESREDPELSSDGESHDESKPRPSSGRRSSSKRSPRKSLNNNECSLSLACQRTCAAISFLVTHIRATILHARSNVGKENRKASAAPSKEHISAIFDVLIGLIQDGGLPPSSRDRHDCKGAEDRAAIRECATVNLLRLCDGSLQLEKDHLSPRMWHVLGRSFLDEDASVRGKNNILSSTLPS